MRQQFNLYIIIALVLGLRSTATATAQETVARDTKPELAKSGADSESARTLLNELKSKIGQDPKKLAELARERGRQAMAEFQFGPQIAKAQSRERRQEEKRIDLRTRAERATEERTTLRTRLDEEIDQIRRQFSDDQPECDRQLTMVLNAYAPRLQELKDEAKRCAELAEKTTVKLAELRREVLALEQTKRLMAQGRTTKSSRQLFVDNAMLKEEEVDETTAPTSISVANSNTPLRSAEDLLKEIDQ